jgi:hypothetical protein
MGDHQIKASHLVLRQKEERIALKMTARDWRFGGEHIYRVSIMPER